MQNVEFGCRAALGANDDHASIALERLNVALKVRGTHVVKDCVNATEFLGNNLNEICVVVIDKNISTECCTRVQFCLATRGHHNFGAHCFGHLNGHGANARAATVNQNAFAFTKVEHPLQIAPHSAGNLGECTGIEQADTLGHRHDLANGNSDFLGVAATGEQRGDALTNSIERQRCAHTDNCSRALQSKDLTGARRWRIVTLALQNVSAVDCRCGDVNDDLAWFGAWIWHFGPLESFWSSCCLLGDGKHQASSLLYLITTKRSPRSSSRILSE